MDDTDDTEGLTWDCEYCGAQFQWDDEAYSYGEAILCFSCMDNLGD